MSEESKTLILGNILGKVELLVPAISTLDAKVDSRVGSLYREIAALRAEMSNLKMRVYLIAGILTLVLNALGKGADLLGFF